MEASRRAVVFINVPRPTVSSARRERPKVFRMETGQSRPYLPWHLHTQMVPVAPTLTVGPTWRRSWGMGLDELSSMYSTPVLLVWWATYRLCVKYWPLINGEEYNRGEWVSCASVKLESIIYLMLTLPSHSKWVFHSGQQECKLYPYYHCDTY